MSRSFPKLSLDSFVLHEKSFITAISYIDHVRVKREPSFVPIENRVIIYAAQSPAYCLDIYALSVNIDDTKMKSIVLGKASRIVNT